MPLRPTARPAVESMYRFVLWLVPTVEKFLRRQKFLLGDRLQMSRRRAGRGRRRHGRGPSWSARATGSGPPILRAAAAVDGSLVPSPFLTVPEPPLCTTNPPPCRPCILHDRSLTCRSRCPPTILPSSMPSEGSSGSAVPAKPRWLLAIPDAIRQLEALDRELLTRRDLERLFGVSKVRAAALMTAFGAGRTGHLLTLPRAELLRQLRRHRKRAAFRGEETRRERVVTAIRKARLTGIRVAVPIEALEARLSGLPESVSVEPGRIEVRFSGAKDAVGRLFALAQAADERLRAVRGARRRGDAGSGGGEVSE